jgi:hypothetical protein
MTSTIITMGPLGPHTTSLATLQSYWVDLALGQGEFPRDPSLSHVKWMKWLGSRLNGHWAHDIQGVVVSHLLSFVPWEVFPMCLCSP